MFGEPVDGVRGEGNRTFLALIGQQFGVGQTRGIIDGDVQELPTQPPPDAAPIALPGAIAGDAMADAVDAAELFDLDVDQLARLLTLVADDGRFGVERRQDAPGCGGARLRRWSRPAGAGAAQWPGRRDAGSADARPRPLPCWSAG